MTSAWSTLPPMSTGTDLQQLVLTRWLCPTAGPRPSPTPLDWKDTWLRCPTMVRPSTLSTRPLLSTLLPSSTTPLLSTTLLLSTTPPCTTPLSFTTPLCTTLPQSTTRPLFTTLLPLPCTSPPSSTPLPPPLPSRPLLRRLAQASLLPPLPTPS